MSKPKSYLVSKRFKPKPGTVEGGCLLSIADPPLKVVKLEEPDDGHIMETSASSSGHMKTEEYWHDIWKGRRKHIWWTEEYFEGKTKELLVDRRIFGMVEKRIFGGHKNIWKGRQKHTWWTEEYLEGRQKNICLTEECLEGKTKEYLVYRRMFGRVDESIFGVHKRIWCT